MALYDDRRILLKQLRHAFITGDETQMCEHVLLNDDFPLPCGGYDSGDDGLGEEATARPESPDIFFGSGAHRPRTYTAVRLDRIKRERENAAKVKHIFWSHREGEPSEAELDEMFAKKTVVLPVKRESSLTKMIENSPPVPPNPFSIYARFNALPQSSGVKEMRIFVNSLEDKRRVPPVSLVVVNSAKVNEVIGLTLWHYVNQNRTPLIEDSVDCYNLMYAEEDGEIDYEFPSLDKKEVIGRFHFASLALVAIPPPKVGGTEETVRVFVMPSQDVIDVVLPAETAHGVTVSQLLTLAADQCPKESTANRLRTKIFIVRDKGDPNNAILSLGKKVLECSTFREFSVSPAETRCEEIRMRKYLALTEASLYQSFMVRLMQKIGSAEIHLGISGEKIEVNPVVKSAGMLPNLLQVKPATYHIDTIADCMMVEENRYRKKSVVRLVRKTPSGCYKNLDFGCDHTTAVAIDQKCKGILHFRGSMTRQEYLEYDNARRNAKMK